MKTPAVIQIIGSPVACQQGVKDTWREVAEWASQQLHSLFGDAVLVEYFDLFSEVLPALPDGAQLPVVIVEGEVISTGGKISIPSIRKKLEELGLVRCR